MGEFGKGIKNFKQSVADDDKKPDASMANPGTLPPITDPQKTTVNQG
jgi:hypothetical protein